MSSTSMQFSLGGNKGIKAMFDRNTQSPKSKYSGIIHAPKDPPNVQHEGKRSSNEHISKNEESDEETGDTGGGENQIEEE